MPTTLTILLRSVCVGACLLWTVPAYAVQPYITPVHPDPMLESWRWRSYPELKELGLRCMAEDRDENMWFGVDAGVVRYDGVSWTPFTPEDGLLGAPVTTLAAAQDGTDGDVQIEKILRFDCSSVRNPFAIGILPNDINGSIGSSQIRQDFIEVHFPFYDALQLP